jgi:hypothetical protein
MILNFLFLVCLNIELSFSQTYYVSITGRDDSGCGSIDGLLLGTLCVFEIFFFFFFSVPCASLGFILATYKDVEDVIFLNGTYLWGFFSMDFSCFFLFFFVCC